MTETRFSPRVSLQVVAGFRFKMRFDMKKTTCAKSLHNDLSDLCVPDDQNMVNTGQNPLRC